MRFTAVILALGLVALAGRAEAGRLTVDDRASLWPGASRADKIDFTERMGRAFAKLSPRLDEHYFMTCLEQTTNIGDTKDLRLEAMVRTCISLVNDGTD